MKPKMLIVMIIFSVAACKSDLERDLKHASYAIEVILNTHIEKNGKRKFYITTPQSKPSEDGYMLGAITDIEIEEKTYTCDEDDYFETHSQTMWYVSLKKSCHLKSKQFEYGKIFQDKCIDILRKAKPLKMNHWYRIRIITTGPSIDPIYFQHTDKEYTVSSFHDPRVKEIEKMRKACEDVP